MKNKQLPNKHEISPRRNIISEVIQKMSTICKYCNTTEIYFEKQNTGKFLPY